MVEKRNFFTEVTANKWKSYLLMFGFILVISSLGGVFGYIYGDFTFVTTITIVATIIYTIIMYYVGGNLLLALSHAKPVTKKEYPHYYNTVEGLAIAAGVPVPGIYVINDTALNAFATGRDPKHSAICVTTGLLNKLNRQELEGVVAHEMAHIKNFDIRVMLFAAVMVGVITLLSDVLLRVFLYGGHARSEKREANQLTMIMVVIAIVLAILSPLIAQLIKLAISRKREFAADAQGAILTRYPEGLASALEKIKGDPDPLVDTANKATAHLYISTPFRKAGGWLAGLFATHPPIDERIKRLRAM